MSNEVDPRIPIQVARQIAKRIMQGRGVGRGSAYLPWLLVQDLRGSRGYSTRVLGWKTNRVHHLFSLLERRYWALLEWAPSVVDVREQYPLLPLELTLTLAESFGLRHPRHPRTKHPIVMTTDFLITRAEGAQLIDEARTTKYTTELQQQRTLEKLEIERLYWESRKTSWAIVTEHALPKALVNNVLFIHDKRRLSDRPRLTEQMIGRVADELTELVREGKDSLSRYAAQCDQMFALNPGDGLAVAYCLIANRCWRIDMHTPIEPCNRLVLLEEPHSIR